MKIEPELNIPAAAIALAQKAERLLEKSGTGLTMGGEPTFIPHFPEADEWNNAAMGEEKLTYARRMASILLEKEYKGAILMQVFGKQFPGEPLPRWNLLLLRHPERTLWKHPARFHLSKAEKREVAPPELPKRFVQKLVGKLGIDAKPLPAKFPTASQRGSAWVLPLDIDDSGDWVSADWSDIWKGSIPLFAGDSPAGLLMPLASLPKDHSRRALTLEVEEGRLNCFIPPLPWEAFEQLIQILDTLAEEGNLGGLILSGYTPSERGKHGIVTYGLAADPGVLEVNLPVAKNWFEYTGHLAVSYQAAEAAGLCPTKLGLNGIVRGSGGGAHLAFGGFDLATNPFLHHPRLIGSMLRYWQHHPVLSYAFTGQFVGPGCQAPRVDEGPLHGLYELEVACEGLEALAGVDDGYYIDQALRNLLTDSSGNTHRAEICFDKFHNALAPNGLLGIVELRAFEMTPRPEELALIGLLARVILARLRRKPFRKPLRRFGPALHDRYFLPAFLEADLRAICEDLAQQGLPFDPAWLDSFFAFRFPKIGRIELDGGVTLVFRQALESFPLMAEESLAANTVRTVDNSTDRIEITALGGPLPDDGVLVVNGITIPFTETTELDHPIAGLRYKCASAYPALHPHVLIQSPLEIRWVRTSDAQVLHAVNYHFWSPSSATYPGRPETPAVAETRRRERWVPAPELHGSTLTYRPAKRSREYRTTLDLRRQG